MKLETYSYKITGISPLLQNTSENMNLSRGVKPGGGKHESEADEAARKVCKDKEGFFHPSQAFRSAIDYAAGGKKIGKRSARAALMAGVFCQDDKVRLIDPDTEKPLQEYGIDRRPIFPKLGGAVMNCRPLFGKWGGILRLQIDTDMLNPSDVLQILQEAGTIAGVGSFRVQKKGWFGRFTAELKK